MSKIFVRTVITTGALLLTFSQAPTFAGGSHSVEKSSTQISSSEVGQSGKIMMPGKAMGRLMMPMMNPGNGKKLFVDKGCVACHAVNGVGGHDAPAMDAHEMDELMNPFEFAAKMWNHAPGMIAAQEEALGEMITFSGSELADIIAFVHSDEVQHGFAEHDLTPMARNMMEHEHGTATAPESHAKEIGHDENKNKQ